jgi:hypothetical protein
MHREELVSVLTLYDANRDCVFDFNEFIELVSDLLCLRDGVLFAPPEAGRNLAKVLARRIPGPARDTINVADLVELDGRWASLITQPDIVAAGGAGLRSLSDQRLHGDLDDLRARRQPPKAYDIFFSLRLNESMEEAKELKAIIERTRPGVKCFLSGDNPNGADLGRIISTALANAKMAIIMGSETYGKKTESNFSTYEEMHFILSEKKPMFLLKMCEEWEEPQTRLMMVSRKFKRWNGQVTQALVDEILTRYDAIARAD